LLVVVLIASGAVTLATIATADTAPTVGEIVADEAPKGEALAEELGLVLEETLPEGCYYFAEVVDGEGYCLDSFATSDEHAYILGMALQGKDVTEGDAETVRTALAEAAKRD
jgi:hypothetical protein